MHPLKWMSCLFSNFVQMISCFDVVSGEAHFLCFQALIIWHKTAQMYAHSPMHILYSDIFSYPFPIPILPLFPSCPPLVLYIQCTLWLADSSSSEVWVTGPNGSFALCHYVCLAFIWMCFHCLFLSMLISPYLYRALQITRHLVTSNRRHASCHCIV